MDFDSLFKVVSNENNLLQKNIKYLSDTKSTDDQKSKYENDQIQWFISTNNYLYCVYYFLVILFGVILIMKNKNVGYKKKSLMLMIPLLIFPFIIIPIELCVYNIIRYIWSFIMLRTYPGNAFQ
jgi:hypothetical protein